MKKLFGGINLTWKKLITFAVISGIYTAIMALLPFTKDTSFRDIAILFEWWIFFGIIIISNGKNPKDSALKCFVFFLISQPLVYLIQVPFSSMGWKLFGYYRYWFLWTLACLPMGFIGYFINKKNILSIIILLPMFFALILLGTGYLNRAFESFPHHLLSGISCFAMIVVISLNLFDRLKYKIISLSSCLVIALVIIIFGINLMNSKFELTKSLDDYNIQLNGEVLVTYFSGTEEGKVEVINENGVYSLKLYGDNRGKYDFTITDEIGMPYSFEYYYDSEEEKVILNRK